MTIPPRLHEWQVNQGAHRAAADELKALMDAGYRLLNDRTKGSGAWWNQALDWEARVCARLSTCSSAEMALFDMITRDIPKRFILENELTVQSQFGPMIFPGIYPSTRLDAKLDKLRLIVSRAYGRAETGSEAAIETREGG